MPRVSLSWLVAKIRIRRCELKLSVRVSISDWIEATLWAESRMIVG